MSGETVNDCVICRGLDVGQRAAMRAGLIEIPSGGPVCVQCVDAFSANLLENSRRGRRSGRSESRQ
jgi:hypothetical protein